MAHYERLANGKYAYTTTVQVISPEDFTNPNHTIVTGSLKSSDNLTAIYPTFGIKSSSANDYFTNGQGISLGNNIMTSGGDRTYLQYNNFTSKIIDGQTYYGVLIEAQTFLGAVLRNTTDTTYTIKVGPTKVTITYIPPNSNTIATTSFATSSEISTTVNKSMTLARISGGIPINSIVLNVNLEPNV